MNTNGLAKHYHSLTPQERFPLLVAAAERGDEIERERLMTSAPMQILHVPDYNGFALAFRELADRHVQTLLFLAANYYQALLSWNDETDPEGELFSAALALGYIIRVHLVAWEKLCAEFSIDPEVLITHLPGYDTIQHVKLATEKAALVPDGADRYVQQLGGEDAHAVTADDIHAALRELLFRRAEWWGGVIPSA